MNLHEYQPKERFSTKANYYTYRPEYPIEIIKILQKEIRFSQNFIVADIGAGTGKLTKLFIENKNKVYAVEPNEEMLKKANERFKNYLNYSYVNSCAEKTLLESNSIDVITIGQALHWFYIPKVKKEFFRILKEPGYIVIVGNKPSFDNKYLLKEVNELHKKYCYKKNNKIDHEKIPYDDLFKPFSSNNITFSNKLHQNIERTIQGMLSCSFVPDTTQKEHSQYVTTLQKILSKYAENNILEATLSTMVTFGRAK